MKKIIYLAKTGEESPKEIKNLKQIMRRHGFDVVCPDEWAPMNSVFDPEHSLYIREKIIEQCQYMYLPDGWDQYEKTILEAEKAKEWGCNLIFSPKSGYTLTDEEKQEIRKLWRRKDLHALHKKLWKWMAKMSSTQRFLRRDFWEGWSCIDEDDRTEYLYDFSFSCAEGRRRSGDYGQEACKKCPIRATCSPTFTAYKGVYGVDLRDNSPFTQFEKSLAEGDTAEASRLALEIANAEWDDEE